MAFSLFLFIPRAISTRKCASLSSMLLFGAAILHTRHIFGFHFSAPSGTEWASEGGERGEGANENSIPVTLKRETNEENVIGRKGWPRRPHEQWVVSRNQRIVS